MRPQSAAFDAAGIKPGSSIIAQRIADITARNTYKP
jgi:hypothetical protein